MGWLPSRRSCRPTRWRSAGAAAAAGMEAKDYVARGLKTGTNWSCTDPTTGQLAAQPVRLALQPAGLQRQRGEYFLKHLLGTATACRGLDLGDDGQVRAKEGLARRGAAGQSSTCWSLDFRMSTTCVYSDIVLPTASWYEKTTSTPSGHAPFIHPLSTAAVDPAYEGAGRLGDLQGDRAEVFRGRARGLGSRRTVLTPCRSRCTTPRRNSASRRPRLEARRGAS